VAAWIVSTTGMVSGQSEGGHYPGDPRPAQGGPVRLRPRGGTVRTHHLDARRPALPPGRGEADAGRRPAGSQAGKLGPHGEAPAAQHPGDDAGGHTLAAAEVTWLPGEGRMRSPALPDRYTAADLHRVRSGSGRADLAGIVYFDLRLVVLQR